MYTNEKYWDSNIDCRRHGRYKCSECIKQEEDENPVSLTVIDDNATTIEKGRSARNFLKQVEFIQESLDLSEDKMDKLKVSEIGKKYEEAKKQITVGKLKKIVKKELDGEKGVVKTLIRVVADLFKIRRSR